MSVFEAAALRCRLGRCIHEVNTADTWCPRTRAVCRSANDFHSAPITVTEKVYTLNYVGDWFLGSPAGKITVDPATGEYSVSLSNLKPGVEYTFGISVVPPAKHGQIERYGWIIKGITSSDGNFSATGKMARPLYFYNQGGVLVLSTLTKGRCRA